MQQKHTSEKWRPKVKLKHVGLWAFTFPRWPALDDIFGYLYWEIFSSQHGGIVGYSMEKNIGDWSKWTTLH